jgi:hypothetical protein
MAMLHQSTHDLYTRALDRGQRGLLRSIVTPRSRRLIALSESGVACPKNTYHEARTRSVLIREIKGSESRAGDFDRDFNPLRDHNRGRWLNVATARERGRDLPPVALIQIGDAYFVRDGHHRISVAQALGQSTIQATVEVWPVSGPFPWEKPARTQRSPVTAKAKETIHALGAWKRVGVQAQERFLTTLRQSVNALGTTLRISPPPRQGVDRL